MISSLIFQYPEKGKLPSKYFPGYFLFFSTGLYIITSQIAMESIPIHWKYYIWRSCTPIRFKLFL